MALTLRKACRDDVPDIFRIRTSVVENRMSLDQLSALGITDASVVEMLHSQEIGCWVGLDHERPAGFVMARAASGDVFALFVLPEAEGHGLGSLLLRQAEQWLAEQGVHDAWLVTGGTPGLRAQRFYAQRGWCADGEQPDGQIRFTKKLGR